MSRRARAANRKEELRELLKPYVVTHPQVRTPCGYKLTLTKKDGVRVSFPGPVRF
jgi:hypothetical protein